MERIERILTFPPFRYFLLPCPHASIHAVVQSVPELLKETIYSSLFNDLESDPVNTGASSFFLVISPLPSEPATFHAGFAFQLVAQPLELSAFTFVARLNSEGEGAFRYRLLL
jgi:hypothetical protein